MSKAYHHCFAYFSSIIQVLWWQLSSLHSDVDAEVFDLLWSFDFVMHKLSHTHVLPPLPRHWSDFYYLLIFMGNYSTQSSLLGSFIFINSYPWLLLVKLSFLVMSVFFDVACLVQAFPHESVNRSKSYKHVKMTGIEVKIVFRMGGITILFLVNTG